MHSGQNLALFILKIIILKELPGTSGSMNDLVAGKGFTTPINNGYLYNRHTFKGWNTQPDGTGVQYDANSISLDDSYAEDEITLYAQWKINKYTITFISNGTIISTDDACKHGQTPCCSFNRNLLWLLQILRFIFRRMGRFNRYSSGFIACSYR